MNAWASKWIKASNKWINSIQPSWLYAHEETNRRLMRHLELALMIYLKNVYCCHKQWGGEWKKRTVCKFQPLGLCFRNESKHELPLETRFASPLHHLKNTHTHTHRFLSLFHAHLTPILLLKQLFFRASTVEIKTSGPCLTAPVQKHWHFTFSIVARWSIRAFVSLSERKQKAAGRADLWGLKHTYC